MTDEEKLNIDRYERLKRVTETDGWKDIESFLHEIVGTSVDHLIDPRADRKLDDFHRATVTVAQALMHSVNTEYEFGRAVRERIVNKTLSNGE